jgi:hypothetical protein
MPRKLWRHTCCAKDGPFLTGPKLCPNCGRPSECVGWEYDRLEAMAVYQKVYGLKPSGPHRSLADRLFAEFTTSCFYCGGSGLLDNPAEESYVVCPMCTGNGRFLNLDAAAADALRSKVLAEYPNAAAPRRIGKVAGAALAEDTSKGFVIDLSEPASDIES